MPAWRNFILDKGFDTSAAVTKFRAVKFTGEETVGPTTAIGDNVAGVAQETVTSPQQVRGVGVPVATNGMTEMESSAAIAVGVNVGITADGRAAATGTGVRQVGTCIKGCTATGQRITVSLDLPGPLG